MSEARIDYLLNGVASRAERALAAERIGERRDGFDTHLREMGVPSRRESRPRASDLQGSSDRASSAGHDRAAIRKRDEVESSKSTKQPLESQAPVNDASDEDPESEQHNRDSLPAIEISGTIPEEQPIETADAEAPPNTATSDGSGLATQSSQVTTMEATRDGAGNGASLEPESSAVDKRESHHQSTASLTKTGEAESVSRRMSEDGDMSSSVEPSNTDGLPQQHGAMGASATPASDASATTTASYLESANASTGSPGTDGTSQVSIRPVSGPNSEHIDTNDDAAHDQVKRNEAGNSQPSVEIRETPFPAPQEKTAVAQTPVATVAAVTEAAAKAMNSDTSGERAKGGTAIKQDQFDGFVSSLNRLPGNSGTPRAVDGQSVPRVDPARFIERVSKAFQSAHERGGTVTLRLSPAELGSIRVELTVNDGAMTAAVETESDATRRVLMDHLPALRERLADQNIRIERFDVDVRRDGAGSQSNAGTHGESRNNSEGPSRAGQPRPSNGAGQVRQGPTISPSIIGAAELNIVA